LDTGNRVGVACPRADGLISLKVSALVQHAHQKGVIHVFAIQDSIKDTLAGETAGKLEGR
jgi:hypothetical protein